jgi:preprotein translocase subunit SecA
LHAESLRLLGLDPPVGEWAKEEGVGATEIEERLTVAADRKMAEKAANYGAELMRMAEKSLLLQLLDHTWKDHLLQLDHLRQGINLRAYAQRDPLNEYKREAFELFEGMLVHLRDQVTSVLSHVELRVEPPPPVEAPAFATMQYGEPAAAEREPALAEANGGFPGPAARPAPPPPARAQQRRANGGSPPQRGGGQPAEPRAPWAGTGRNAPCPCGSGKKYKHCHGRI